MPVIISEESAEITKFLKNHRIGVLATADTAGVPHAATIYYMVDDDFNIYFMTKQETTKHRNLEANPQAALAIYEASNQSTVQIRGTVTVVEATVMQKIFNHILESSLKTSTSGTPPVSRLSAGNYVGYCLKPLSIRLAVYARPDHDQTDQLFDVVVPEGLPLEK